MCMEEFAIQIESLKNILGYIDKRLMSNEFSFDLDNKLIILMLNYIQEGNKYRLSKIIGDINTLTEEEFSDEKEFVQLFYYVQDIKEIKENFGVLNYSYENFKKIYSNLTFNNDISPLLDKIYSEIHFIADNIFIILNNYENLNFINDKISMTIRHFISFIQKIMDLYYPEVKLTEEE